VSSKAAQLTRARRATAQPPTIQSSNSLFVSNIKVSFGRLQVALEPAIGLLDGIVFVARLAHVQRPRWRRLTLQRGAAFRAFAGWEQARHGFQILEVEFRVCALVDA
jgi:hypothetical protein